MQPTMHCDSDSPPSSELVPSLPVKDLTADALVMKRKVPTLYDQERKNRISFEENDKMPAIMRIVLGKFDAKVDVLPKHVRKITESVNRKNIGLAGECQKNNYDKLTRFLPMKCYDEVQQFTNFLNESKENLLLLINYLSENFRNIAEKYDEFKAKMDYLFQWESIMNEYSWAGKKTKDTIEIHALRTTLPCKVVISQMIIAYGIDSCLFPKWGLKCVKNIKRDPDTKIVTAVCKGESLLTAKSDTTSKLVTRSKSREKKEFDISAACESSNLPLSLCSVKSGISVIEQVEHGDGANFQLIASEKTLSEPSDYKNYVVLSSENDPLEIYTVPSNWIINGGKEIRYPKSTRSGLSEENLIKSASSPDDTWDTYKIHKIFSYHDTFKEATEEVNRLSDEDSLCSKFFDCKRSKNSKSQIDEAGSLLQLQHTKSKRTRNSSRMPVKDLKRPRSNGSLQKSPSEKPKYRSSEKVNQSDEISDKIDNLKNIVNNVKDAVDDMRDIIQTMRRDMADEFCKIYGRICPVEQVMLERPTISKHMQEVRKYLKLDTEEDVKQFDEYLNKSPANVRAFKAVLKRAVKTRDNIASEFKEILCFVFNYFEIGKYYTWCGAKTKVGNRGALCKTLTCKVIMDYVTESYKGSRNSLNFKSWGRYFIKICYSKVHRKKARGIHRSEKKVKSNKVKQVNNEKNLNSSHISSATHEPISCHVDSPVATPQDELDTSSHNDISNASRTAKDSHTSQASCLSTTSKTSNAQMNHADNVDDTIYEELVFSMSDIEESWDDYKDFLKVEGSDEESD